MSPDPIRLTAPPPKSPTSPGRAKVENWATAVVIPTPGTGRFSMRPSKPDGSTATMPWARRVATVQPARRIRRGAVGMRASGGP